MTSEADDDQIKERDAEIRDPSKRVLAGWVCDWIIASNPPECSTVPRKDIEELVGYKWDEPRMTFVLIEANAHLRRTTHFEWSVTPEGLYMLSDAERKERNARDQSSALQAHVRVIERSSTIRAERLTAQERAELENQRAISRYLLEEGKRAMRKRWLPPMQPPPKQIP